jgi:hypothetical protein
MRFLFRMARNVALNHNKCMQRMFQHWKSHCFTLTPYTTPGVVDHLQRPMMALHPNSYNGLYSASSIAAMKIQVLKLQSELAALTNTNEVNGLLAAEKALNK